MIEDLFPIGSAGLAPLYLGVAYGFHTGMCLWPLGLHGLFLLGRNCVAHGNVSPGVVRSAGVLRFLAVYVRLRPAVL